MSQTEAAGAKPARLSAESVRLAVNRWSRQGFFRVPNMGDCIDVHDVVPRASHTVRLTSEYEERTVSRVSRPYHGGAVDDRGTPPDPWDIPAQQPTDFEDRTENFPVPHTECVETCSSCGGVGQVTCGTCQGQGTVNCPFCMGRGYRERMVTRTENGPNGVPQMVTETVREGCTCMGGQVTCSTCNGRGRVTCGTCAGTGEVVTSDLLTVRFRKEEHCEVLTGTDVPRQLLRAATGKVRVDENGERVETFPGVLPEVDDVARTLLAKSQSPAENARLLFQRLHVEELGVQEVFYTYRGGHVRRLYIYGDDGRVHAARAPWALLRVGLVLGTVFAFLLAVVLGLLFLAHH